MCVFVYILCIYIISCYRVVHLKYLPILFISQSLVKLKNEIKEYPPFFFFNVRKAFNEKVIIELRSEREVVGAEGWKKRGGGISKGGVRWAWKCV